MDTTNSFSFDPVANTIGSIAPIPRATGETRALNFNGQMYVMGGGRVAPNPSNEVDIYDPASNTWSVGIPFNNARRNFPTDTNGTDHIWLAGGYDIDGITPLASMEIFDCPQVTPTPTPTATATPSVTPTRDSHGDTGTTDSDATAAPDTVSASHALARSWNSLMWGTREATREFLSFTDGGRPQLKMEGRTPRARGSLAIGR